MILPKMVLLPTVKTTLCCPYIDNSVHIFCTSFLMENAYDKEIECVVCTPQIIECGGWRVERHPHHHRQRGSMCRGAATGLGGVARQRDEEGGRWHRSFSYVR